MSSPGSCDLLDFHRREEKPMWWRMFDRVCTAEELRDDSAAFKVSGPLASRHQRSYRKCKHTVRSVTGM